MTEEHLADPTAPPKWVQHILTIFFDLLYHPFAWTYDLVSWVVSWGQWQSWIRQVLPYLGSGKILELGSGPGHLLEAGQKTDHHILGLDFSPQMLKLAQTRLSKSNLPPRLLRGDGRSLPFPSASFSQVVATFPTEYIFTAQTLSEIHRVLDENGEFHCIPMAWIRENGTIYRFLGWLFRFTGQSRDLNDLHLEQFIRLFSKAGFALHWHVENLPHSHVLILHARKNSPET
ncbi:methyltransferase domain-containing protein [bacterium]|nr:methyltransferase domain-containing protein [bacterium]